MSKRALVIRAEGNSHVLEFSPQDLRDVISDVIRTDDVIGIFFLDRLSEYPERDPSPMPLPDTGRGQTSSGLYTLPPKAARRTVQAEPGPPSRFGKGGRGLGRGRG
jgi:hypothetical protein